MTQQVFTGNRSDVLWLPKSGIFQESINGEQRRKICGPFIVMDKKNSNNRDYPSDSTIPAVDEYINEWVRPGRALGEYTHPGTPRVDPRNACIGIEELILDRHNAIYTGKARVLKTAPGVALNALLDEGIPMGVSSRMLGSQDKMSGSIIVARVVTAADVVLDPSNAEAMVEVIMEHKELVMEEDASLEQGFDMWEHQLSSRGRNAVEDVLKGFLDRIWKAI